MGEQPYTRNELSGSVEGHVVQAGAVHGDVVFHSPAQGPTPKYVETFERLAARTEAQMRAEDVAAAAAADARSKRLRKVLRRKRVFFWLLWSCIAFGAAWVKLGQGQEHGKATIETVFIGFIVTLLMLLGYAGAKYEIQYGRPYPWGSRR
ncbi:hypothetical protein ABR737_25210 [Streptomyces sp. Edi2]|uniref:hypothetical protein n=1 Tax=Streptomyces sp. Edi2 TaxID=3162528 RepID=UPI0033060C63